LPPGSRRDGQVFPGLHGDVQVPHGAAAQLLQRGLQQVMISDAHSAGGDESIAPGCGAHRFRDEDGQPAVLYPGALEHAYRVGPARMRR
jgi:hypothetical protein